MHAGLRSGTSAVIVLAVTALVSAVAQASAPPSPQPAAEATCPPAPDHLLVPPVGAAWIGGWEGVFEPPNGPDIALWLIDEVLVGSIPVTDGQLTYAQPACDPMLTGGIGDRFLVDDRRPGLADPRRHRPCGSSGRRHVVPMLVESDAPSVYDVTSLAAARALVLSGDMPVGASPTPPPVSPIARLDPPATPRPSA